MHLLSLLLATLLAILNVGDWLTTRAVIAHGIGREANPIMEALMKVLGVDGALLLKGFVVSLIGFGSAAGVFPTPPLIVPPLLALMVALYVWVVVHNWRVLRS